jgi:pimeloyl-ACP methyl ester carboxylesterase
MSSPVISLPKNRTNVRSPVALRLMLKASSRLSPRVTDRITTRLFSLPRQQKLPAVPDAPGLRAESFHVDSSVGRLAVWTWGEGRTVLLAHGWEGHAGQMTPFVAPLVAEGFRVVTFDMPAHARSSGRFAHVMSMAQAIRDVAEAVMPVVGGHHEPLHALVGHSLGGAASALAIYHGLRTQHVVLLAPVAEPRPFARKMAAYLELSPERTEGLIEGIRRIAGGDLGSIDVRFLARQMDVPALIFHDPSDREVPFEHGREIAAEWPRAQFVELSGLGHTRLLKDAAVIERAVQFIRTPATNLPVLKGA